MKLSDIKTTIITIKQAHVNIVSDFLAIATRLDKIKIPHSENVNTVYSIQHGSFTWTPRNNTINVTADIGGIFRLNLLSSLQFNVSTSMFTGINTTSAILLNGSTETFQISPSNGNLASASLTWYVKTIIELGK